MSRGWSLAPSDDQWGPFTRIDFNTDGTLSTPWTKFHESGSNPSTNIEGLIIPVFPKIRISYDDIEPLSLAIAAIYTEAFSGILEPGFVWDIKLMYSESYKYELSKSEDLEAQVKLQLLEQGLPKYIWVVICYGKEIRISDFIFDATGISNAMLGLEIVTYYSEVKNHIHEFLKQNDRESFFNHRLKADYYKFLVNKTEA